MLRELSCHLHHNRQHLPDLLFSAAREHSDDRPLIQTGCCPEVCHICFINFNCIQQRMADEVNLILIFAVKIFFKGQDHKHPFHILLDLMHPRSFPGPKLWGNVIEHPDPLFSRKFRDPEVKSGIVNQNEHIRFIGHNILFAEFHVPQDGFDVKQYLQKTHKGKIAVMFYQNSALRLHQVSPPTAKVCRCIMLLQLLHKV